MSRLVIILQEDTRASTLQGLTANRGMGFCCEDRLLHAGGEFAKLPVTCFFHDFGACDHFVISTLSHLPFCNFG